MKNIKLKIKKNKLDEIQNLKNAEAVVSTMDVSKWEEQMNTPKWDEQIKQILGEGKWYHFDELKEKWLPVSDNLQPTFDTHYIVFKNPNSASNYNLQPFVLNECQYYLKFDIKEKHPFGQQICVSDPNRFRNIIRAKPINNRINGFYASET